jgi:predicted esterase
MNSGDSIGVPDSWTPVLDSRHLIFIAPQGVGNKHPVGQRIDAAVKAALLIKEYFLTDPKRVYVAGLSGGARIASDVALAYPEIFHGTIQCSGSDYLRPVSRTAVTDSDLNAHPELYGESSLPCRQQEVRSGVRFVLITGTRDWREHFIEDICKNGFQRDGFQALLLDLPDLGHAVCSGDILEKALQFIEDGKPQGDGADLRL